MVPNPGANPGKKCGFGTVVVYSREQNHHFRVIFCQGSTKIPLRIRPVLHGEGGAFFRRIKTTLTKVFMFYRCYKLPNICSGNVRPELIKTIL